MEGTGLEEDTRDEDDEQKDKDQDMEGAEEGDQKEDSGLALGNPDEDKMDTDEGDTQERQYAGPKGSQAGPQGYGEGQEDA